MTHLGNKPLRAAVPSRAPTVGLVVAALVIGASAWSSASNVPGSAGVLRRTGLAFVAPLAGRWPLTRRGCVWIAAGWFVVGSFIAVPLWWATGTLIPLAACVAAVPALIGAGVGWGSSTPGPLLEESGAASPPALMQLRTRVDAEGRLIGHEYVDEGGDPIPGD